jgi:HK97 family phage portal protein
MANKSAVPYVARRQNFAQAFAPASPMVQQLQSMGSVGTLFAIVTKLSKGCASVEWELWRKAKSGKPEDRVKVTVHLALNIWNKPNNFFTRQEFVETTNQHKELTGEQWWVVARDKRSTLPLELWPVRPDHMQPVPDAENFIVGYVYTGPDGEKIPLGLDQVIMVRDPDPETPYRGMGPVQTILADLAASNQAAQYQANFFANSAEPGGIIEVDERLTDDEFNELTTRWREQHQGVSNAHRVAVLEKARWVDRKYTMKDMQFTELRSASSEVIRGAFGFPKPLLGAVDDVNRANAEAAEYVFAKWLLVPRLEQIKQALNAEFLPLFYPAGAVPDVEFDYCSPVEEDAERAMAGRKNVAETAKIWIDLGADTAEVCEMLDLPLLTITKPDPAPVIQASPEPGTEPDPVPPPAGAAANRAKHWPTAAAALPDEDHPDLTPVQESWEQHLDELLIAYAGITAAQRADLLQQIHDIVSSGSTLDLLQLETASAAGAAALLAALVSIGKDAADHVVDEAAAQDTEISPVPPRADKLTELADAVAAMLAAGLAMSAVREALRVWNPADTADTVVSKVKVTLDALTDAQPKAWLGSALTQAQRQGRMNTLLAAPTTAWYASEQLDSNTCEPCRRVNGKWLGNSIIENVNRLYPTGGYIDCLGRDRCRGMVIGIWRPKQVGDK